MPGASIELRIGVPPAQRAAAAALYWEAFGRKLRPALGTPPRSLAVIERGLQPARAVAASASGELVGLAGFHLDGAAFAEVRYAHVAAEYGRLSAALRMLPLVLLNRDPAPGELLMDGIVVSPRHRGAGIGTALLRRVFRLAQERGLTTVRLDVVDTNPAARRLYEREGFVAVRTERTPYLRRLMGFSASTTMRRDVP